MANYKKIAIVGGGAFGIALGKLGAQRAQQVIIWCRDSVVCDSINSYHHHPHSLSAVMLPDNVEASLDLPYCLRHADAVIFAVPLAALTEVLIKARPYIEPASTIVSTAKGIADGTLFLPVDIIEHSLPQVMAERACYLSGPSFAIELAMGLPTALTIASKDAHAAHQFQSMFSNPNCRLYYSPDVIGVCVGGALKNVIAIGAGVCYELRLGKNAQASLITRGLAEIGRLAKHMGGQIETLLGLSGVGDLVLSATDPMSRNFRLGTLLAQGYTTEQALGHIGSIVEGAKTALATLPLMEKYKIDLPICRMVYEVLYENLPPLMAISALLGREPKNEIK